MIFNINDLDENYGARLDKGLYSIYILKKFKTVEEAERARNNLAKQMNRLRNQKRYEPVSFMIGVSETVGDGAWSMYKRTGKPGRPVKVIHGAPTKPHIHIVVYGKMAATFCNEFAAKLNKRYGKKEDKKPGKKKDEKYAISKHIKENRSYMIRYVYEQSRTLRWGGDFDFKKYCKFFKTDIV